MSTAKASGTADNPAVTASISPAVMKAMAGRLEQSLPVGNEGAGVVVQAGASSAAQALMGRTVAILGGAMRRHAERADLRAGLGDAHHDHSAIHGGDNRHSTTAPSRQRQSRPHSLLVRTNYPLPPQRIVKTRLVLVAIMRMLTTPKLTASAPKCDS